MSKEEVRRLLIEAGGGSIKELRSQAENELNISLSDDSLQALLTELEQEGIVEQERGQWQLTEFGRKHSIGTVTIYELDSIATESSLEEVGLEPVNIVVTFSLGREVDLAALSEDLTCAEYHPEDYPFLVLRPLEETSVTLLIPTNGIVSLVGAKSKSEILSAIDIFLNELETLGVSVESPAEEAKVQTTVLMGELDIELELSTVAVGLGLEKSEYEPEVFPGLVYKMSDESTAMIFRSGKYLINGTKSYAQGVKAMHQLKQNLSEIGVPIGT